MFNLISTVFLAVTLNCPGLQTFFLPRPGLQFHHNKHQRPAYWPNRIPSWAKQPQHHGQDKFRPSFANDGWEAISGEYGVPPPRPDQSRDTPHRPFDDTPPRTFDAPPFFNSVDSYGAPLAPPIVPSDRPTPSYGPPKRPTPAIVPKPAPAPPAIVPKPSYHPPVNSDRDQNIIFSLLSRKLEFLRFLFHKKINFFTGFFQIGKEPGVLVEYGRPPSPHGKPEYRPHHDTVHFTHHHDCQIHGHDHYHDRPKYRTTEPPTRRTTTSPPFSFATTTTSRPYSSPSTYYPVQTSTYEPVEPLDSYGAPSGIIISEVDPTPSPIYFNPRRVSTRFPASSRPTVKPENQDDSVYFEQDPLPTKKYRDGGSPDATQSYGAPVLAPYNPTQGVEDQIAAEDTLDAVDTLIEGTENEGLDYEGSGVYDDLSNIIDIRSKDQTQKEEGVPEPSGKFQSIHANWRPMFLSRARMMDTNEITGQEQENEIKNDGRTTNAFQLVEDSAGEDATGELETYLQIEASSSMTELDRVVTTSPNVLSPEQLNSNTTDVYEGNEHFADDNDILGDNSLEGDDELYTMFLEIMNDTQIVTLDTAEAEEILKDIRNMANTSIDESENEIDDSNPIPDLETENTDKQEGGLANYSNNEIENEIEEADQIPVLETENNNQDERIAVNSSLNDDILNEINELEPDFEIEDNIANESAKKEEDPGRPNSVEEILQVIRNATEDRLNELDSNESDIRPDQIVFTTALPPLIPADQTMIIEEIPTKEPIIIDGKGLNGKITGIINIRDDKQYEYDPASGALVTVQSSTV